MSLIRYGLKNIGWRTFVVFVVFNAQMVPFLFPRRVNSDGLF